MFKLMYRVRKTWAYMLKDFYSVHETPHFERMLSLLIVLL